MGIGSGISGGVPVPVFSRTQDRTTVGMGGCPVSSRTYVNRDPHYTRRGRHSNRCSPRCERVPDVKRYTDWYRRTGSTGLDHRGSTRDGDGTEGSTGVYFTGPLGTKLGTWTGSRRRTSVCPSGSWTTCVDGFPTSPSPSSINDTHSWLVLTVQSTPHPRQSLVHPLTQDYPAVKSLVLTTGTPRLRSTECRVVTEEEEAVTEVVELL